MGERRSIEEFFEEVEGEIRELETKLGPLQGEPLGEGAVNLKKMLDISRAMNSTLELDQLLNYVMDKVIEITRAERGFLILMGKEGELDFKVARNLSREQIESAEFEISHSIIGEVVKANQPILIENAFEDGRFAQQVSVRDLELRSIMCVPLQAKGKLTGVVYVDNRSVVGQFDQDDLDLLILFASQAAIAIENARLYEDLHRSQEEIQRWNRELERKVEEKTREIRASEEKYRTLVERALAGIYIFQDSKFKFVNPEVEKITGYSRSQILGRNFWEAIAPQDKEWVKQRGLKRERGEEVEGHYSLKLQRKDGEIRDVEIFASRIEYEGRPAVQGWVRDITEEKRAEEQVKRGYKQIKELTDIAGSILGEKELKKVLDQIATAVKKFAGFRRVLISLMDEHFNARLVSSAGLTKKEIAEVRRSSMTPEERKMVFSDRFLLGSSYYIPHDRMPFRGRGIPSRPRQEGFQGWHPNDLLLIPLRGTTGRLIGYISVDEPDDGRIPTAESLIPVELFAKLASVAIENANLFDELQRRLQELNTLNRIGQILSSTLVLEKLLPEIYKQAGRVMDTTNFYIALYDESLDEVNFVFTVDEGKLLKEPPVKRRGGKGMTEYIIHTKAPLLVKRDVTEKQRELGVEMNGKPASSWLGVPIIAGERVLGVIGVQSYTEENVYDEGHLELLSTIASQAAVAIENARLFAEYGRKVNQLSALLEVSRSLSSTLSFDEVLSRIVTNVKELLDCHLSVLYVLEEGGVLTPKAVKGKYEDQIASHPLKLGEGLAGSVAQNGEAKMLNDVHLTSTSRLPIKARVIQSLLSVPLRAKGKMLGVFTLARFGERKRFAQEELELCEIFASQAASVIEDAQLFDEINQAYEELKLTQEQLVQAGKLAAVGELAAGVAHELNNPIGGILGYSQYALEKLNKGTSLTDKELESFRKYLDYIQQGSQRCKGIVENLLRFSRSSSTDFERLDINKVLESSFTFTEHQLKLSRVEVVKDLAPQLPHLVGNANQLEQVFTNLIINAGKAMPHGGKLEVKSVYDAKSSTVKVEISDTGCGIPPENLDKIFDPFFTTRKPGEGTGLGLSVSYGIVKSHKGKIDVESELGRGTKFVITLPIAGSLPRGCGARANRRNRDVK